MEIYQTLEITRNSPTSRVFNLRLNRPALHNALSLDFFDELPKALASLGENPNAAVVILSGSGDHFCSGIDPIALNAIGAAAIADRGRAAEFLRRQTKLMQDMITTVERCRKPVIAAIHGACIGAGIDLITACDVRYCTESAFFSVNEVNLGFPADLGTLQRLPSIVGYGKAVELALTARRFSGLEAKELGLVSRVFGSKDAMDEGVQAIAEGIAAKNPPAVTGTKAILLRSRDLTVNQGLDYVATWNSGMLASI